MDLSPLIFVALAVAWAVYLVPKAIKHHDEVRRSRSVERFSHTMRVLARREPVSGRNARLVIAPLRRAARPAVETKPRPVAPVAAPAAAPRPVPAAVRRAAARKAARRRRNVLALILVANAVVIGLAVAKVVAWPWVAIPVGLLVAWLVACRVSVKIERRAVRRPSSLIEIGDLPEVDTELTGEIPAVPAAPPVPAPAVPVDMPAAELPAVLSGEIPIVRESVPGAWDMQPTPLPTYVSKPSAPRRTVSTIDLDSTGVWSSGRSEIDSALAREAELIEKAEKVVREADERRANGA
ncbi:MAG: hypothetical protein LT071_11520 [Nocardioides sp.]|nr:hypothetical protein [Nocardioides sp.]